jgi:hypothetical protein
MRKIAVQEPSQDVLRTAEALKNLDFNLEMLSSQRSVIEKLEGLNNEQLSLLRGCLQRCGHPRFRKEFAASRHVPYVNLAEFKKAIDNAESPKLTRLIKIVGMLLQSKVYLFWTRK